MVAEEKTALLAQLEACKKTLLDALHGVSEEDARRTPTEGKWSILECVEHLANSEEYLFAQILAATPADEPLVNEKRERGILKWGPERTRPVEAPEVMRPAGRFTSMHEALQHFLAVHERTIRFVGSYEGDPRSQITWHPLYGTVNCYENLLLIVIHPLRHAKQIEECKSALSSRSA